MSKTKKLLAVMMSVIMAMAISVFAFAESTGTASSAVTSAMQTVAGDMIATGNAVIPIALTVVGISLVVIFGVRMFRKIAK